MLVHDLGSFVMCLLKLLLYYIYFFNSLGRKLTVLVSLAPINVSRKPNVLAFVLYNVQSYSLRTNYTTMKSQAWNLQKQPKCISR